MTDGRGAGSGHCGDGAGTAAAAAAAEDTGPGRARSARSRQSTGALLQARPAGDKPRAGAVPARAAAHARSICDIDLLIGLSI